MLGKIKKLLGINYYPLNRIEINGKQLLKNYQYLNSIASEVKIAPVVKSNAYGHGIELVARLLDFQNPPFFCVDSLYEAAQLKKAGVKSPILIMGFLDSRNLKFRKLPYSFTVFDINFARQLNKYQPNAKIHIKVDTGMNRIGVPLSDLKKFLIQIKKLKNLEIEGLMSHLSSPRSSKSYTGVQIKNFEEANKIFDDLEIRPKWKHIAASGGLNKISAKKLGQISNLARCGISIYGSLTEGNTLPALELKSQIVQIKKLNEGALVGYDRTFETKRNSVIGILPLGYNDGVDRRLSNIGFVKYKNNFCPIIGRVSMNITTIDITNVYNPKMGDEVVVISSNPKDKNSILNLAKAANTIPHDLLSHLHANALRRVIV